MRWFLSVCLAGAMPATLFGLAEDPGRVDRRGEPDEVGAQPETADSSSELDCGPYCEWDGAQPSEANLIEPADFDKAVEHSAAWIRAVLRAEHVPDDLEDRIVGVVNGINGFDITRAAFAVGSRQFAVTQDSRGITVAVREIGESDCVTADRRHDAQAYLTRTLGELFNHAAAIEHLRRKEVTPFGARLAVDNNLYGENGFALSTSERRRISQLPPQEASRERRRLRMLWEARARDLDPTLPREFVGGAGNYWWGRAFVWTDGCLVLFSAGKGYGGKMLQIDMPDWFRKEKVSATRLKSYGLPMPPKDAPGKDEN